MVRRGHHAAVRGFTLVELLVVIGIIAVLISILLPALSKANKAAKRTQCLSNQRQIAMGIVMYENAYMGYVPLGVPGYNQNVRGWEKRDQWNGGSDITGVTRWDRGLGMVKDQAPGLGGMGEGAFVNLAQLFALGLIKSPQVFYCPDRSDDPEFTYETGWQIERSGLTRRYLGYSYRIIGQAPNGINNPTDIDVPEGRTLAHQKLMQLKQGRFKPNPMSLSSDIFYGKDGDVSTNGAAFPHTQPYGIVVGFSDGHAEFKQLKRGDWMLSRYMAQAGATPTNSDRGAYGFLMWRSFDTDNYEPPRRRYGAAIGVDANGNGG